VVRVHRLLRDPGAYRRLGSIWLEGEHLCRAAVERGLAIRQALVDERAWDDAALRSLAQRAERIAVLDAPVFESLSPLPSPARIGFLIDRIEPGAIEPEAASLVLDRVQDAGNAGSMLRSAAAFGVRQVLALQGTASLWSPKVLRAGMGAHFALALHEGFAVADLDALRVPLVATTSHGSEAVALPEARLPRPCAWLFGHEGQGIDAALAARCALTVRIPQPGGQESLNVAAAAAVCLYESARRV
jgi:TrmH family RNA methyltransferase